MLIELRHLTIHTRMSEETTAFSASLYVNGKKIGTAENTGKGGATIIQADSHHFWKVIGEAEAYCKSLPPIIYEGEALQVDLELYLNNIVFDFALQKENKRFERKKSSDQFTGIIYGTDTSYKRVTFSDGAGNKIPIDTIVKNNPSYLSEQVKAVNKKLKDGERILNTNIPKHILN